MYKWIYKEMNDIVIYVKEHECSLSISSRHFCIGRLKVLNNLIDECVKTGILTTDSGQCLIKKAVIIRMLIDESSMFI